jgi:ankyrin repeat protein
MDSWHLYQSANKYLDEHYCAKHPFMQQIAEYLSEKDMANFALTSRQVYGAINHFLYFYNARKNTSSALIWGCELGVLGTVLHSLENHANVNTCICSGQEKQSPPLHVAAENGHHEIIRLLLQANAEIDGRSSGGDTALCIAASNGHHLAVAELLKAGANIELADGWGKTPLSLAAKNRFVPVVVQLVAAGASINHVDTFGDTPLILAAGRGQAQIIAQLLKAKAEVDISNSRGCTALSEAAAMGFSTIVKRLIRAGANVQ